MKTGRMLRGIASRLSVREPSGEPSGVAKAAWPNAAGLGSTMLGKFSYSWSSHLSARVPDWLIRGRQSIPRLSTTQK